MSKPLAGATGTTSEKAHSATIIASMSMSVDGFVAGPSDEVDQLFAWYGTLSEASGALLQDVARSFGPSSRAGVPSTSPKVGVDNTRWASRSSWSPTACRTAGTRLRSPS
jgi:hypothetical protein